jgi:hypothetical protein
MRISLLSLCAIMLAAWCGQAASAAAGEACGFCQHHSHSKCDDACDKGCDSGEPLCRFCQHKCHCPLTDCCLFRHMDRNNYAEVDAINCSCNGSYKFPVPPLYTYHWPGMYSQQLMTDYQSPWRFPPLKPYTDEAPARAAGLSTSGTQTVSWNAAEPAYSSGEPEPESAKIARMYANP